jgi:hypothetical protein
LVKLSICTDILSISGGCGCCSGRGSFFGVIEAVGVFAAARLFEVEVVVSAVFKAEEAEAGRSSSMGSCMFCKASIVAEGGVFSPSIGFERYRLAGRRLSRELGEGVPLTAVNARLAFGLLSFS